MEKSPGGRYYPDMSGSRPFLSLPRGTRFQLWKQVVLFAVIVAVILLIHQGYSETRESLVRTHYARQRSLALQVETGLGFHLDVIRTVLTYWSTSPVMLELSEKTLSSMTHIQTVHSDYMTAVSRIGASGVLLHSVPVTEAVSGMVVASQEELSEMVLTGQPVVSEPFGTAGGRLHLAYMVPVHGEEGDFRGSLAALIPFTQVMDDLLDRVVREGGPGARLITSDGTVLYSTSEDEEGLHLAQALAGSDSLLASLTAVLEEGAGGTETEYMEEPVGGGRTVETLALVHPIRFHGTQWVLVLSEPSGSVLGGLSGLRNTWLVGSVAILLLALVYTSLRVRRTVTSREQARWSDVSRRSELLARTIERSGDLVVVMDSLQRITFANPAASRIIGISGEYVGKTLEDMDLREVTPPPEEITRRIDEEGGYSGRVGGVLAGRRFLLDVTVSTGVGEDGSVENYSVIGKDVLLQTEMERRLNEQQKMEAIGMLAGGIAHDFNNLLVSIQGCAEVLALRFPDSPEVLSSAETIIAAAGRGADLTRQLLGYAGRGKHRVQSVGLADAVRNVARLLGRTLDQRVEVLTELQEDVHVEGDPAQLEQVVLNLAVNARDAMPGGGTLTFRVYGRPAGERDGHWMDGASGEVAVLEVSDTGCGIPPEIRARVFEPFFTTKREEGTGMGLATVMGIVRNHGGIVELRSEPGRGTTFTIAMPAADRDEEDALSGESGTEAPSGRGTVLLVDDDTSVRRTTSGMLAQMGFEVLEAGSGEEALEVYAAEAACIDAVVLDLSMPGMDGEICYEGLRRVDPDVRVVLSSGYSQDGRVQRLLEKGVASFLQKPFRMSELAAYLSEVIGPGVDCGEGSAR